MTLRGARLTRAMGRIIESRGSDRGDDRGVHPRASSGMLSGVGAGLRAGDCAEDAAGDMWEGVRQGESVEEEAIEEGIEAACDVEEPEFLDPLERNRGRATWIVFDFSVFAFSLEDRFSGMLRLSSLLEIFAFAADLFSSKRL